QVNRQAAVAPRGERRAGARLRGEDLGETPAHRAEPPVGEPLYFHAAILSPRRRSRAPGPVGPRGTARKQAVRGHGECNLIMTTYTRTRRPVVGSASPT